MLETLNNIQFQHRSVEMLNGQIAFNKMSVKHPHIQTFIPRTKVKWHMPR